jgi:metallophosphoesterase superfamily enzyme
VFPTFNLLPVHHDFQQYLFTIIFIVQLVMNRIDRLAAIVIQLQSKRLVKAQDIAHKFSLSLRTVYRDIKALEEAVYL